jgi:hypothetical protein
MKIDAMQLIKTSGIFTDTLMDIRRKIGEGVRAMAPENSVRREALKNILDTVDYAKNYWLPEGSTQRLMASDLKNKTVEGLKLMADNPKTTAGLMAGGTGLGVLLNARNTQRGNVPKKKKRR